MKLNEFLRIPLRLPRNFEEKSTTTRRSAHHKTKRCCKHSRRPVYARWRLPSPSSGSWPLTSARKSSRRTHLDLLAAAQTSAMKYLARLTLIFRPRDRNDLEALDARARQSANTRDTTFLPEPGSLPRSPAYFSLAFRVFRLWSCERRNDRLWRCRFSGNLFFFFARYCCIIDERQRVEGVEESKKFKLSWLLSRLEEIYEGKARGDCKGKEKRLINLGE